MKKIYILSDMEGISGIRRSEQVQSSSPEYEEGRKLMMADINAAIEGAFDAGADEVVACDTHGGGGQVRIGEMDSRAMYETPGGGKLLPALDETFSGVVLLGHHARAGTLNGFLDHTMSSAHWFRYTLNGQEMGEIGIEAAYAGHFGVPVIAVSGDRALADEAIELFGRVECAVVKWALGRNRARCLPHGKGLAVIKETVKKAVEHADSFEPFKPEAPAVMQLTLYRSDMADELAKRPDVVRIDARTVQKNVASLADAWIW